MVVQVNKTTAIAKGAEIVAAVLAAATQGISHAL